MDLRQAQQELTADLTPLYSDREAALIADWVMENLTGRGKLDRRMNSTKPLPEAVLEKYHRYRAELLAHRPVQYVLHESWFGGQKFYVDENVLIPRPETEELVEWAIESISAAQSLQADGPRQPGAILDVGTGSGCIAITLAKNLSSSVIHGCDISTGALEVAARNAAGLRENLFFHQLDFLDRKTWTTLPPIRWLISNPPYIPLNEKSSLAPHVVAAEPALALFVPDADPLIFYRAIADFARQRQLTEGAIFVEIHEDIAAGVEDVFKKAGFGQIILRKDMQGRNRMVMAS